MLHLVLDSSQPRAMSNEGLCVAQAPAEILQVLGVVVRRSLVGLNFQPSSTLCSSFPRSWAVRLTVSAKIPPITALEAFARFSRSDRCWVTDRFLIRLSSQSILPRSETELFKKTTAFVATALVPFAAKVSVVPCCSVRFGTAEREQAELVRNNTEFCMRTGRCSSQESRLSLICPCPPARSCICLPRASEPFERQIELFKKTTAFVATALLWCPSQQK